MKRIGKKGFIVKTIKLAIFVLVIILLFFLIKNGWNVQDAINNMLGFMGIRI